MDVEAAICDLKRRVDELERLVGVLAKEAQLQQAAIIYNFKAINAALARRDKDS